jgi:hypothetical protein
VGEGVGLRVGVAVGVGVGAAIESPNDKNAQIAIDASKNIAYITFFCFIVNALLVDF